MLKFTTFWVMYNQCIMLQFLPSSRVGDDDAVVDGKAVTGQSCDIPRLDLDGFTQCFGQRIKI